MWFLSPWRPKMNISIKSLREMFSFGSGMVASSLLNTVFENLYLLVIGKFFTAASLGFYNRAQALQVVVSQSLATITNRVTFPVFAELQKEKERLRSGMQKAMVTVAFLQFPMLIGMAAVAKPLVLSLLGDQWAPSIPYLQLFCFAGLLYPIHVLNLNILTALGRSDLLFKLELIKRAIVITNILITCRYGVLVMVLGQVIVNIISYFINSYYSKRLIGYSAWDQVCDLYPILGISCMMGIIVSLSYPFMPLDNIGQLIFKVGLGAIVYLGIGMLIRLSVLEEIFSLLRKSSQMAVKVK